MASRLADEPPRDIATEEPVETSSDGYVGKPVLMDRRGSVSAVKWSSPMEKNTVSVVAQ